jgi:kumamolisin
MNCRNWLAIAVASALVSAAALPAFAQDDGVTFFYGDLLVQTVRVIPGVGTVVLPESSFPQPTGWASTHIELLIPETPLVEPPGPGVQPASTTSTPETPASLACVYRLVPQSNGCDPNKVSAVATGGSNTIAIVDAYNDKTALADLKKFSKKFGLPAPNLTVVFCSAKSCTGVKTPPPSCATKRIACDWGIEETLDLQAAHAMAPHAKIILVEAFSSSNTDLYRAEVAAAKLVASAGGGEISNSWGSDESSTEQTTDKDFVQPGVVFFASTGDHKAGTHKPDVEYPSTSPNVVAVGGTTILRDRGTFAFQGESAWIDTGGGLSKVETRPSFQDGIKTLVGSHRGVPDMAADADPASGLTIYISATCCGVKRAGFIIVGGTSLASPLSAAMTNAAGNFRTSSTAQLTKIYDNLASSNYDNFYNDITSGHCGNGPGGKFVNAVTGWDLCTGVGTPKGLSGL